MSTIYSGTGIVRMTLTDHAGSFSMQQLSSPQGWNPNHPKALEITRQSAKADVTRPAFSRCPGCTPTSASSKTTSLKESIYPLVNAMDIFHL
jgi:hypothetical protein